jgi:hypothetical protein
MENAVSTIVSRTLTVRYHGENSQECCNDAVHRAPRSGISGGGKYGTPAIALADGYEDNVDEGDVMYEYLPRCRSVSDRINSIYTGSGGKVQLTSAHPKKHVRCYPYT